MFIENKIRKKLSTKETDNFYHYRGNSTSSLIQENYRNKGNNKITELWTILQRESQNS